MESEYSESGNEVQREHPFPPKNQWQRISEKNEAPTLERVIGRVQLVENLSPKATDERITQK